VTWKIFSRRKALDQPPLKARVAVLEIRLNDLAARMSLVEKQRGDLAWLIDKWVEPEDTLIDALRERVVALEEKLDA